MRHKLSKAPCWSVTVAIAVVSVGQAGAQTVWQKMKQNVLQQECQQGNQQACQSLAKMKQAPQTAPQKQPSGQPALQTPGAGPQQTTHGPDGSGPIHPPDGTKVEETVLAPLAPGAKFFISPHGVHVATFETSGSRAVIYYDGVPGPKFDEILGGNGNMPTEIQVVFSPDGKRYAYCARLGSEFVVMLDGKELARSSESNMGRFNGTSCALGFSSNSQHFFYASAVGRSTSLGGHFTRFFWDGKQAAVTTAEGVQLNGPPGGIPLALSPDGNHYAYVATDPADPNKWVLVIDGKVAPYRGGDPQWSPDSQHLYTILLTPVPGRGQVAEAMLDGKPFMRADQIKLHVAPVGNMWVAEVNAASTTPQPLRFLVVNGKKVPGSEIVNQRGPALDQVTISPDGKHFAARITTADNRQYVFVDGKRGQEYQQVDHITFTAEPSTVTYTAFTNGKPYVVIGEQESDTCFPEQSNPVVQIHGELMTAPRGGRAGTICGLTGGAQTVFMDGKTLPLPNGASSASGLRFSPDGRHYAYVAGFQGAQRLIIDGVVQMNSNVGSSSVQRAYFVFSPDSQHIAADSGPPTPASQFASGIFLDGKYTPVVPTPGMKRLEFTADNKHIAWAQGASGDTFRIYVDGKAVAEADAAVPSSSKEAWWDMAPDGSLSVLAQDANNLKRITITPSAGTSIASLGGGGAMLARTGN